MPTYSPFYNANLLPAANWSKPKKMADISSVATAAGTAGGNLTGATPYSFSPAYGGKPQVVDPLDAARRAAAGNMANLGGFNELAGGVNQFNFDELMKQIRAGFPGYDTAIGSASGFINSQLRGEVPLDVQNQLSQFAAERGVGLGMAPGAPNTSAALLKSFYDTSTRLQNQGLQNYMGFLGSVPRAQQFNPASMFVGGGDIADAQNMANLIAAAPDPASRAAAELAAARRGANLGQNQTAPGQGIWTPDYTGSATSDMLNRLLRSYGGGFGPTAPTNQYVGGGFTASQSDPSGYIGDTYYDYIYGPMDVSGGTDYNPMPYAGGPGYQPWEGDFFPEGNLANDNWTYEDTSGGGYNPMPDVGGGFDPFGIGSDIGF